jgi:hypothetical protein
MEDVKDDLLDDQSGPEDDDWPSQVSPDAGQTNRRKRALDAGLSRWIPPSGGWWG